MKEGIDLPRKSDLPPAMEAPLYDPQEARERVEELVAGGVRPLISVPLAYAENFAREGLRVLEHTDWSSGAERSVIAGTIGIDPFLQEKEERAVFEVDPAQVQMTPRFTGADKAFHGVVVFEQGIPPEALSAKGMFAQGAWDSSAAGDTKRPLHEGEASQQNVH